MVRSHGVLGEAHVALDPLMPLLVDRLGDSNVPGSDGRASAKHQDAYTYKASLQRVRCITRTSTANVNACSRCHAISHPAAVWAIECDRAKLKAQEQQSIDAAQSFL